MSYGREIGSSELADVLGFEGDDHARRVKATRWMRELGIARQRKKGGRWFVTMPDLRAKAAHVYAAFLAHGHESAH